MPAVLQVIDHQEVSATILDADGSFVGQLQDIKIAAENVHPFAIYDRPPDDDAFSLGPSYQHCCARRRVLEGPRHHPPPPRASTVYQTPISGWQAAPLPLSSSCLPTNWLCVSAYPVNTAFLAALRNAGVNCRALSLSSPQIIGDAVELCETIDLTGLLFADAVAGGCRAQMDPQLLPKWLAFSAVVKAVAAALAPASRTVWALVMEGGCLSGSLVSSTLRALLVEARRFSVRVLRADSVGQLRQEMDACAVGSDLAALVRYQADGHREMGQVQPLDELTGPPTAIRMSHLATTGGQAAGRRSVIDSLEVLVQVAVVADEAMPVTGTVVRQSPAAPHLRYGDPVFAVCLHDFSLHSSCKLACDPWSVRLAPQNFTETETLSSLNAFVASHFLLDSLVDASQLEYVTTDATTSVNNPLLTAELNRIYGQTKQFDSLRQKLQCLRLPEQCANSATFRYHICTDLKLKTSRQVEAALAIYKLNLCEQLVAPCPVRVFRGDELAVERAMTGGGEGDSVGQVMVRFSASVSVLMTGEDDPDSKLGISLLSGVSDEMFELLFKFVYTWSPVMVLADPSEADDEPPTDRRLLRLDGDRVRLILAPLGNRNALTHLAQVHMPLIVSELLGYLEPRGIEQG